MKLTLTRVACVTAVAVLAWVTSGYALYTSTPTPTLAQNNSPKDASAPKEKEPAKTETTEKTEKTTTTTGGDPDDWDIFGPIRLCSACPEPSGEVELKFTTEWGTSSSGEHDSVSAGPELEYAIGTP